MMLHQVRGSTRPGNLHQIPSDLSYQSILVVSYESRDVAVTDPSIDCVAVRD